MEQGVGTIGQSVVIKGDLSAKEDLTIEGRVEGTVELAQNVLTIGPNGRIKAQVVAKAVVVMGRVNGNITATERINIDEQAFIDGDLVAPRIAIAEGASFQGKIDMQTPKAPADGKRSATPSQSAGAGRR